MIKNAHLQSIKIIFTFRETIHIFPVWQSSAVWLFTGLDPRTRGWGRGWPGWGDVWPSRPRSDLGAGGRELPVSLHHPLLLPVPVLHLPGLWLQDELPGGLHLSPWRGQSHWPLITKSPDHQRPVPVQKLLSVLYWYLQFGYWRSSICFVEYKYHPDLPPHPGTASGTSLTSNNKRLHVCDCVRNLVIMLVQLLHVSHTTCHTFYC